jgi:hypothetical protein
MLNNIEGVFHSSSSFIRIRLHTKNQCPRWPGSGLKSNSGGGFLTNNNTTPTKLFCFGLSVGL